MRMKLAGQALQLIETAMLVILSHGGPYDSARLLYAYARCKVAAAQNGSSDARKTGECRHCLDLFGAKLSTRPDQLGPESLEVDERGSLFDARMSHKWYRERLSSW